MAYLSLPYESEPVRATGDEDYPTLWRGQLVHLPTGEWEVQATDSYMFVRLRCVKHVEDDGPDLIAGPISHEAMVAIAKTGRFRAHEMIEPVNFDGDPWGEFYSRDLKRGDKGKWPDVEKIEPVIDGESFTVSLSLALLTDLVAALGNPDVTAPIDITFESPSAKSDPSLRPMVVRVRGKKSVGLLCPIKRDD
jgi:hypothetical protein